MLAKVRNKTVIGLTFEKRKGKDIRLKLAYEKGAT
jgi:hypothetical protein